MTVNRELFARIHDLISQFPELHDQYTWEAEAGEGSNPDSCGTTRCVAGWAVWTKATDMGLLTQKRQTTSYEVRTAIARDLGMDTEAFYDSEENDTDLGDGYEGAPTDYDVLGGKLLGLSAEQAFSLFHDMHSVRVLARVKRFADTGTDLTYAEQIAFNRR